MNTLLTINFTNKEIFFLFFKVFSIIFSFVYLVFCIFVFQQTKLMNITVKTKNDKVLIFLSRLQLIFSIFLFLIAIFL